MGLALPLPEAAASAEIVALVEVSSVRAVEKMLIVPPSPSPEEGPFAFILNSVPWTSTASPEMLTFVQEP